LLSVLLCMWILSSHNSIHCAPTYWSDFKNTISPFFYSRSKLNIFFLNRLNDLIFSILINIISKNCKEIYCEKYYLSQDSNLELHHFVRHHTNSTTEAYGNTYRNNQYNLFRLLLDRSEWLDCVRARCRGDIKRHIYVHAHTTFSRAAFFILRMNSSGWTA